MGKSTRTLVMFAAILLFSLVLMEIGQPVAQANSAAVATMRVTMAATSTVIDLKNGLLLDTKVSSEESIKPKLKIDVSQPVLMGPAGPAVNNFNKAVDDIVQQTVDGFKKDNAETESAATLPPEIAELGSYIDVKYEVVYTANNLISIKFNVGWYSAGAAHPNSYSISLNYDIASTSVLALADLFKPNAKYLAALSSYSIMALKKAGKLDFPDGAAPKEDNFRSWNIRKDGLQINFDDYQVTPHAVGPQQVIVPYAVLKNIIRLDGLLAKLVK